MYIVQEMVDIEPSAPVAFQHRADADTYFRQLCCQAGRPMQEFSGIDLVNETTGTLRFAGDDIRSVQMWEVPLNEEGLDFSGN